MLSKESCVIFLNKNVRLERNLDNHIEERFGILMEVNDIDLVIEFKGRVQIYDLSSLCSIREAF